MSAFAAAKWRSRGCSRAECVLSLKSQLISISNKERSLVKQTKQKKNSKSGPYNVVVGARAVAAAVLAKADPKRGAFANRLYWVQLWAPRGPGKLSTQALIHLSIDFENKN